MEQRGKGTELARERREERLAARAEEASKFKQEISIFVLALFPHRLSTALGNNVRCTRILCLVSERGEQRWPLKSLWPWILATRLGAASLRGAYYAILSHTGKRKCLQKLTSFLCIIFQVKFL